MTNKNFDLKDEYREWFGKKFPAILNLPYEEVIRTPEYQVGKDAWLASREELNREQIEKDMEKSKAFSEWLEKNTKEAYDKYKKFQDDEIRKKDERWQKASPKEKYRIWWHDLNRINGTPSTLEEIERENANAFSLGLILSRQACIKELEDWFYNYAKIDCFENTEGKEFLIEDLIAKLKEVQAHKHIHYKQEDNGKWECDCGEEIA